VGVEIRHLLNRDDRTGFRSGNIELDRFFQRFAGQNQFRHHLGTTYVAVEGDQSLAFATVAPAQLHPPALSRRGLRGLPAHPVPALRLARLAVDERAQGRGLGKELLKFVFGLARTLARDDGCVGVLVDAKPEAVEFYRQYGFDFIELVAGQVGDRPAPVSMFLELGAIGDGSGR
jgi:GNAT superfamily N-acetyltransferase